MWTLVPCSFCWSFIIRKWFNKFLYQFHFLSFSFFIEAGLRISRCVLHWLILILIPYSFKMAAGSTFVHKTDFIDYCSSKTQTAETKMAIKCMLENYLTFMRETCETSSKWTIFSKMRFIAMFIRELSPQFAFYLLSRWLKKKSINDFVPIFLCQIT